MSSPTSACAEVGACVEILAARSASEYESFGRLVREYLANLGFEVDFQDVERELSALDVAYGGDDGVALLAVVGDEVVGAVGVRQISPHTAELKRMYVQPPWRGQGVGRRLGDRAIEEARRRGYSRLRLDTLQRMTAAVSYYRSVGFADIPAYCPNPMRDALYLELQL